ncbi:UNVERIFIED_CONTAM: hypothetical protein K2H54_036422, partial [Gekko kuhli]
MPAALPKSKQKYDKRETHPSGLKASAVPTKAERARTYDHLKKTREEECMKRTMLSEVLQYIQDSSACQQWLSRQADIDSGLNPTLPVTSNSGLLPITQLHISADDTSQPE